MSAETYAALEDAIRAHIADENDSAGIVTDWYTIAAVEVLADADQRTDYLHVSSDAPAHTLHGLVDMAHRRMSREVQ